MNGIIIARPSALEGIAPTISGEAKWCYIGKEVMVREEISRVLGEGSRFFLKDELQKTAEELRKPFLDFIANLGKRQKNMLNWWASRFASRSPFQTDFFLLLCYKALVEKIVKRHVEENRPICIFVEDPWLFSDLRENYRGRTDIEFIGKPRLAIRKFRFLAKGLVRRSIFACRLFVSWTLMLYYYGGRRPKVVKKGENNVAILSYAEKRAFVNGIYSDPYTGGLADLLKANGRNVIRPMHLRCPLSLSKEVGRLGSIMWPLILDLWPWDLPIALAQWWNPYMSEDKIGNLKVSGHSTQTLINREWWEELSTCSFNNTLLFYKATLRFFRKGWCQSLVYIYENQPWEKMLCKAAKETNNVRVVGYQHSSMPRFLLSQFLGRGEEEIMPLPDKLLTTGGQLREMYEEGGIPSDRLSIGGAWRYKYLWEKRCKPAGETNNNEHKQTIFIPLPVEPKYARALLLYVIHEFLEGYGKENIELMVKPHPDTPLSAIGIEENQLKGLTIVNGSVEDLLRKADIVIYNSSGVGLEALLYGNKKVVRYVPENLIDMDRIDWIPQDLVVTLHDGDGIEESLSAHERPKASNGELSSLCQRYFSEVKPQVWLEELELT